MKSIKSRKYQLTINNPIEHGFSHEVIKSTLSQWKSLQYWCICDEIGIEEKTYHTHVYFSSMNAIQFETVHKRFFGAHIEVVRGSDSENRDYIRKEGKWVNDRKHESNLSDTFEESGELSLEPSKRKKQSEEVLEMLENGADNLEIIRAFPSEMHHLKSLDANRQMLLEDEYRSKFRDLEVTYIFGDTGVGKTSYVMGLYGYENVYKIVNYLHPFDNYKGQKVLLFDEFRSSLPISDMLQYLDGYPLSLPCRYSDRIACFNIVYIISNIPFEDQYPNVQLSEPKTWEAFKRRVHKVWQFSDVTADNPFVGGSDIV